MVADNTALKGIQFLENIKAILLVEYNTHGICVEVGSESEERFHRFHVDFILVYPNTKKREKIGHADISKFNNVDFEKMETQSYKQEISQLDYHARLYERIYSEEEKRFLGIEKKWFIDTVWCLETIAFLPAYRGLELGLIAIENIQKVLMTPNQTNLFFGFAFPPQHWEGEHSAIKYYDGHNNLTLKESEYKLEEFYKKANFTYLRECTNSEDEELVKRAYIDKHRSSHLFFKVV